MAPTLSRLFWHDGRLKHVTFAIDGRGRGVVELAVLLYRDNDATQRVPLLVRCEGVSKYYCTLDVAELRDNAGAGNVSNGYLKGQTLWLYFSDGLLEVQAKRIRVSEC